MFTDPMKNLKMVPIHEHHIVADLGAGSGYYSVAAGALASLGKVYAIEIIKDFLHTINAKVKDAHLGNVEILWGNIEKVGGTKIKTGIIDVGIASNVLFQLEDRKQFVDEVHRILKKGGKVLLVDWNADGSIVTPKGALLKNTALALFEGKGFALERAIDAGAHHYGMILVKQ